MPRQLAKYLLLVSIVYLSALVILIFRLLFSFSEGISVIIHFDLGLVGQQKRTER